MDVILDSNIYLKDVRFVTTGFVGLFDYLKRTGHHLVIPEVIFQEVLARHRDLLTDALAKVTEHWNEATRYIVSDNPQLPAIDVEAESKLLFQRLNQPTKWVKAGRYNQSSKVRALRRGDAWHQAHQRSSPF